MRKHLLCLAVVLPGLPCAGESINVDFGLPGAGPSATYGAARLAGVWNSIEGQHTPFTDPQVIYDLVDINGEATGVTLYQFGGQDLVAEDDPSVTGDHALLLNDALVTHSQGLETCLWINGLENGTYEVIAYAWRPNHPDKKSKVRHDFTLGQPLIGGKWTGAHAEGITYAKHRVEVTSGFIGSHSGNLVGSDLVVGAAMNGFQLRRLDDCRADLNGDGEVSFSDLLEVLIDWGPCFACTEDLDADGDVGFADLLGIISGWGPCK